MIGCYRPNPNPPSERNIKIAALRRSGLTLQQIGDLQEPKIGRERVRQIVWKVNYYTRRAEAASVT